MDASIAYRKRLSERINLCPETREDLEVTFGKGNVYDSDELDKEFEIIGFLAPFVTLRRKSDNARGVMIFQDLPRFYFNWTEKGKD